MSRRGIYGQDRCDTDVLSMTLIYNTYLYLLRACAGAPPSGENWHCSFSLMYLLKAYHYFAFRTSIDAVSSHGRDLLSVMTFPAKENALLMQHSFLVSQDTFWPAETGLERLGLVKFPQTQLTQSHPDSPLKPKN